MCGIVGYIGKKDAFPILIKGLRRLEYRGYEVRFYRVSHLVEELEQALHAGKLKQFRSKLEKVDLMILDEMGYLPFGKEGAELLFQIISEFYEQKSLYVSLYFNGN